MREKNHMDDTPDSPVFMDEDHRQRLFSERWKRLQDKKTIVIRTASFIIAHKQVTGSEAIRMALEVYDAAEAVFAEEEVLLRNNFR
jgi:hypothetical protein